MRLRRLRNSREGENHHLDRWLLTYADLITLLLGLFVILYTMSKVDNTKYSRVVQALGGAFGKTAVLSGSTSPMLADQLLGQRQSIESKLNGALFEDMRANLVTVTQDERGVTVHLAEELLFSSGDATLKNTSLGSLDLLASVLKGLPNEIRVEGHTDNLPISTPAYPSNWHLSVARAMNTGNYLLSRHGLKPEKVTIVGYSQYRPLAPNISDSDRAKNRRVDIVIVAAQVPPTTQD
jgi:chemotaxis protein MotB